MQLYSVSSDPDDVGMSTSEHYSMATSSDHLYCSPEACHSEVEFVSFVGDEMMSSLNTPTHIDRDSVYTPFSGGHTPTTGYQNIISSLSEPDLEKNPGSCSDFRFLRTILESDQLSELHKV
eukprot:sb/3476055/